MLDRQTYQFPFASYPAVRLALLFITGILLDYYFHPSLLYWIIGFAVITSCYLLSEFLYRKSINSASYSIAIACYMLLIVTFGGAWHTIFNDQKLPPNISVLKSYTWQDLQFSGTVQQIKQTSTGKYQIDIDVDSTSFSNNISWDKQYRLRTILDPEDIRLPNNIELGNFITVTAMVYPLEPKRNPGQFDYKSYLASIGVYLQAGITKIDSLHPADNEFISWTGIRQTVLDAIDNNFSQQTAPLAKALLIGYKNELQRDQKIAFSRAGLSHIMAVSGLHVGFILAPFWICIPLFWTFRYGKQIGLLLLIGLLLFYAGLTGFSASVMRASLVGSFLAYGRLFNKVRDAKNLTAVAALILLLINPNDIFAIGFQLSFTAVYVILLTVPVISRTLPAWIRYRWYGQPIMIVIVSLVVQLGLFPLLAYHFGELSIVGPLANAFVVPFLGIAVPLALLLLLLSGFFPYASQLLNVPIDWFLSQLNWFVQLTAGWSWSWIQFHTQSLLFFAIWTVFIFFIASLPISKIRWKVLSLLLLLICADQSNRIIHKLQPEKLTVTFFDVGQGDAAFVSTPNNKHFLIDTGRWERDYNSAKYVIIPFLKANDIQKLDAIFLSHPHADHIGGMPELIDHIPIDTIYYSGAGYESKLFQNYQNKAGQKDIPVVPLSAGRSIPIDPAIRLFSYGPAKGVTKSNVNNHSLVLELIYGQSQMLFMGDAEAQQEERITEEYPKLIKTDLLKVGHHGSKTSSSTDFLEHTQATYGIVSVAKRNSFHHPNAAAIRRLQSDSIVLSYTSLSGAIKATSDGRTITIKKEIRRD